MASGIYAEIKKRIELSEPGTVFLTSDFADIATTTVRKCLGRQVEEKNIRRIMDGVYEKPAYGTVKQPTLEELIKIAEIEGIPMEVDHDVVGIAFAYGKHFLDDGEISLTK